MALAALAACPGAQLPSARAELHRAWHVGAETSGKVWALLCGPAADRASRTRELQRQPQTPVAAPALDEAETLEIEQFLAHALAALDYAERVVATGESLHRRLPGCPGVVSTMLACAVQGPGGAPQGEAAMQRMPASPRSDSSPLVQSLLSGSKQTGASSYTVRLADAPVSRMSAQ
jgi:hypothetical protein